MNKTLCSITLTASLAVAQSEKELTAEWERHYRCGKQNYEQHNLPLAENCFVSALAAAERSSTPDSRIGATLGSLGVVLLEQARKQEAEKVIVAAIEAFRRCNVQACSLGVPRALRNLAMLYVQENRLFDAERLLLQALRIYTDVHADAVSIADTYDTLGQLELNRSRPAAAESYFRRALLLTQQAPHADRTRGYLYSGLSAALRDMTRPQESAEAAQQAFAAASADPQANPLDIVNHACLLATTSARIKDYDLAEHSLVRAHDMLARLPAADYVERGQVLMGFGKLRFLQKRFQDAAEFDSRALEILARHLSADHPQILALKAEYADALRKLKRKADAKRVEEELRIAAKLSPDDPGSKHRVDVSDLRGR